MSFTNIVLFVQMNFAVVKFVSSYQGSAFLRICCLQIRNKQYGYNSAEMTNQNESEQQILLVRDNVSFPMPWYLPL